MKTERILISTARSGCARLALLSIGCSILTGAMGMQGCIENPGPDARLQAKDTAFQYIGQAYLKGHDVLVYSVRYDEDSTYFEVTNNSKERIDSAQVLIQFGLIAPRDSLFFEQFAINYLNRIVDLKPLESRSYGFAPQQFQSPPASRSSQFWPPWFHLILLKFDDGAPQHHPVAGIYTGEYTALDSMHFKYSGYVNGVIDADGRFNMLLAPDPDGFWGFVKGIVDTSRKGGGSLRLNNWEQGTKQYFPSAPFIYSSGRLETTFRPVLLNEISIDSLGMVMQKVESVAEIRP